MPEKISYVNLYEGLATIQPDGAVPDTRMKDAEQVRDMITRAIRFDMQDRDYKRSRLSGLVQGNPPYSREKMVAAGRADECNVNWRHAKYFLEQARGMVYDLFSEAETYSTVYLKESVADYEAKGRIATEEFQELLKQDVEHDFTAQQSQGQMVMFGTGPQVFTDEYDWRTISIESKSLFVPEWASSNVNRWEWAAIILEYTPDRLFARIVNPKVAQNRGWNVAATRRAIMNAHPLTRTGVMYQNWSWHQDRLKNGTYYYADQTKAVRVAHFYFREFPEEGEEDGRITECMIDLDGYGQTKEGGSPEYLFHGLRRYSRWQEVIHPMYWNHDINGYHHSVTGLGIEMYSALEYMNRLFCRVADDAFAPEMVFRPTTSSDREKMSIAPFGRYAVIPSSLEPIQMTVQKFLQEKVAVHREVQNMVKENLSQFRSQALTKTQGNPVTARQIDYEAAEAAKMGKTQITRIYEQYDWLYQEKYRRATNPKLTSSHRGGKLALAFIEACKERGVTAEELRKVRCVNATRVVGQGSQFTRQQALEFLLGLVTMLPEAGRANLIKEVIASRAGQAKVGAFYPEQQQSPALLEQQSDANLQVSGMKTGVPPVFVPTQNPLIYAGTFLQAAMGAKKAAMQGGDPHEASAFLGLALPAIQQHIARLAQDKTRQQVVKDMGAEFQDLSAFNEKLTVKLQEQANEQAQAQQQMAAIQNGSDPETQVGLAKVQSQHQIGMVKAQAGLALKQQKMNADLALKARQQNVDMALRDAETAHGLRMDRASTATKIQLDRARAAAKPKPAND